MKKFWKVLGGVALAASVIPFAVRKDEAKDETTVQALLWKVTNKPHPDHENERSIVLDIGFHKPEFLKDTEYVDFGDVCDCGCHEEDFAEDCCCEDDFADNCCCGSEPAEACGCGCEASVETVAENAPAEETPADPNV